MQTNFENHLITSRIKFNEVQQMCRDGLLYEEHIDCAEFIYPLKFASYNTTTRRFNELEFSSDFETFSFLNELDQSSIYQIVYPANIFMFHQDHFSIETNFGMTAHFKIAHNTCGIRD